MIDLHCHLLPGLDDGPATLDASLALARASAAQGITTIACTPHLLAGCYEAPGPVVRAAVARMQEALDAAGIGIRLVAGNDIHIAPDIVAQLRSGRALALNDSRYVLIELPHGLVLPRIEHTLFDLLAAGYVPVLTHPERMGWIERGYALLHRLSKSGVAMQVTAGALTGGFGPRAQHWSRRMLDDGLVDLVATDAHDATHRPPLLAAALEVVSGRAGAERARRIFFGVPEAILADRALPAAPVVAAAHACARRHGLWAQARGLIAGPRQARRAGHG